MTDVEEIKNYFDSKFSSLKKELQSKKPSQKRKREHEFKHKSNKKQFEFNSKLLEDLEDLSKLAAEGSKRRSSKMIKRIIEDINSRNKLIRMADKSPAGWGTVMEYESDSLASDTDDGKKIRAAERRAMQKQNKRRRVSSTVSRRHDDFRTSGRPSFRVNFSNKRNGAKPTDICLSCGNKGHWKRDCPKADQN